MMMRYNGSHKVADNYGIGGIMTTAQQLMTADELLVLPDDGFRTELVRGELRRISPASQKHGRLGAKVTGPLERYVDAHNLGAVFVAETGFPVSSNPDTVLAPDVAFVRQERIEAVGDVEVVSQDDLYIEVMGHVIDWLEASARMVVVVNPRKRTVTGYRSLTEITILTEQDTLQGGDVVPGWSLPVRDIFR